MAHALDPRIAGPDAWKTWHKDAWRLLGRLGVSWVVLWCGAWALVVLGLVRAGQGTAWFLLAFPFMQVLGVLAQPLLQRAMDQAAVGQPLDAGRAIAAARDDLRGARGWLAGRLLGQGLTTLAMVGVIAAASWLGDGDSAARPGRENPLFPAVNLLLFLVFVPAVLRMNGLMDYHYWLRVRHGLGLGPACTLNDRAMERNRLATWTVVVGMAGSLVLLSILPVVALFGMPLFQLFHAALTRCAYHDLFEGGTGLAARSTQTAAQPAAAVRA